MKRKAILFICLIIILALPVFAKDIAMPQVIMPTVASNGMGGHHIAYTDNVFSLLVNPAAMVRTQQKSFFTLSSSLFSPQATFGLFKSMKGLVKGDENAIGDALDTLSKQEGKIALGMEIRELFPFSFAWVANGFGFGLWNRTFMNINVIGTYVEVNAFSDVMFPIGFAFRIFNFEHSSLDMGVTVKPFARGMVWEEEKITELIGGTDKFIDNINAPVIVGGTFDIGLMYRWRGLRLGFTFNDIYSRGKVVYEYNNSGAKNKNDYYIPFTMNLGAAFDIKLFRFLGLTLAADWHDIRNVFLQDDYLRRNWLLDLSAGFQLSLFNIIKLRVGMNELLPSCGVGFDFGPVEIDAAYYGKEFGREPGQLSAAVLEVSIAIRPDAKKRNWPWTRRSIVGLFTGVETIEPGTAK